MTSNTLERVAGGDTILLATHRPEAQTGTEHSARSSPHVTPRHPAQRFVARRRTIEPATATATAPLLAALPERRGAGDFGPLAHYLRDRDITDIFINGPHDLWFDRGEGLVHDASWVCPGEQELRQLAVRLIALGGRHIDEANPCVDVRLHDGVRLHAVLPPASPSGTVLSIRIPPIHRFRLADLDDRGFFAGDVDIDFVRREVAARSNILITGAGGSGKTTLLSALLSEAPSDERIVAIEDVAELRVDHPHFVSLESRQANLEGAGELSLQRLLREALRMRPDRLVLGECRGPEIRELLSALNTGHDGGAGTLHANALEDVAARIEALGALAGLSPEAIARQAVSAIQVVFHVERVAGRRVLAHAGRLGVDEQGRLDVHGLQESSPRSRRFARDAIGSGPYDIGIGTLTWPDHPFSIDRLRNPVSSGVPSHRSDAALAATSLSPGSGGQRTTRGRHA